MHQPNNLVAIASMSVSLMIHCSTTIPEGQSADKENAKIGPRQIRRGLASIVTGGESGIQLARFAGSLPTCRYAAALIEQD